MTKVQNPIVLFWRWWFTPRSSDPTIRYRERALRVLLPIILILRTIALIYAYSDYARTLEPPRYIPLWLAVLVVYVPLSLSGYFLLKKRVDLAGVCFLLNWYLSNMFNLPADGYWYSSTQVSLIIEIILSTLLLPSRAILPYMIFHIITVGLWGDWLDVHYYDPPLLSSGQPIAVFSRTIVTLALQEFIIMFVVRYLRLEMEKSLRLQQTTINQLENEINERRRLQEEREKFFLELEQRNSELERLAYTLSHELKSPLITIRGFVGFVYEDALSGNMSRLKTDVQRIADGAEKMLRLINELIDLMSVGRSVQEIKEMSFRDLVDEAIELVHEKIITKNIAVHIADKFPDVYGDRKRLLEVVQNLLDNSVKYMGNQPEPKIKIGCRTEQEDLPVFFVRDNGMGIEPRFSKRIFEIFSKLDVKSEGTGVGLALVKRIIETHGGRIWVESDGLGKGSTFCFTLTDAKKTK